MRFFDRAALFAEACLEFGLLSTEDSSVCILCENIKRLLDFLQRSYISFGTMCIMKINVALDMT